VLCRPLYYLQSWKQYCNATSSTNPWNIVYKSASGKIKNQIKTAFLKTHGSHTEELRETIMCTLEHLIPKDEETVATDHHKQIRTNIDESMGTEDDREFTAEEIRYAIKRKDHKKKRKKKRSQVKTALQAKYYCGPSKDSLD
jgi:hypothetical protein